MLFKKFQLEYSSKIMGTDQDKSILFFFRGPLNETIIFDSNGILSFFKKETLIAKNKELSVWNCYNRM